MRCREVIDASLDKLCVLSMFKGDVWICMEVMDASLDKFYKKIYEKKSTIPENALRVIAHSVSITQLLF